MDILTSIVSGIRLRSALYARFEVRAPWAVEFARGAERARFGLVTDGCCWLKRAAGDPVLLRAGDLFLTLDPDALILGDDPRTPPRACASLMEHATNQKHVLRFGGSGAPATFITGWFGFEPSASKPLTGLLPELLHFRVDGERHGALGAALDLLTLETAHGEAGGEVVIRGLANLLFVEAMRAHIAAAPVAEQGLRAALADARLGRAVKAMHAAPKKSWTVETLAATAGMSRSAFAAAFRAALSRTPLDYLTGLRIDLARRLLLETDRPLAAIAYEVGYGTDGAFAKAFRRHTGTSPGAFRRREATPRRDQGRR